MNTGMFIELSALATFADWPEALPYAGDEAAFVRNDGEVLIIHRGQCLKLGQITAVEHKAMARWYSDPGIFIELDMLSSLVGWHQTPNDALINVYVRRDGSVEQMRDGKPIKLGRLDKAQYAAVCAWHEHVVS